ncbi:hypothetical protein HK096_003459 [Nowakowskiella sp. JEL0078]|nr:hypothetical protein HK096_003459 [Nowakowskiella sp. JEL0078]
MRKLCVESLTSEIAETTGKSWSALPATTNFLATNISTCQQTSVSPLSSLVPGQQFGIPTFYVNQVGQNRCQTSDVQVGSSKGTNQQPMACLDISPVNNSDTAQPKRRRKKKFDPGESVGPRDEKVGLDAKWTDEMVESFLQLRYHKHAALFSGVKDKNSLSLAWSRVLLDFNIERQNPLSLLQIKNKHDNLQKTYRKIYNSQSETGNKKVPSYPGYWNVLVQYFGDKEGILHKKLADDNSSEDESNNSMDENMKQPYNSHTISSVAEGSSTSIADGLMKLGESLKEAAIIKAGSSKGAVDEKRMKEIVEGVVKSLSIFTEHLEGLVAAIEKRTQQILQFKETIEKGNEQSLNIQHQMY